jgi:hypothetical protein
MKIVRAHGSPPKKRPYCSSMIFYYFLLFYLNNKVERNFWWLPQQNCYPLNPKQNNKKESSLSFNHLWKVNFEQIFDNFSPQNYYPLNLKHNNKKGSFFSFDHFYDVLKCLEVFCIRILNTHNHKGGIKISKRSRLYTFNG